MVYPIVFYHGKQRYTAATDIRQMILAPKELVDTFLFKPYQLIDLHSMTLDKLSDNHPLSLIEYTMKHVWQADFSEHLKSLLLGLKSLPETERLEMVKLITNYLSEKAKFEQPEIFTNFKDACEQDDIEETVMGMTYKQYCMQEGIELGIERGIEQGIERGVAKGLSQGIEEGKKQQTLFIANKLLQHGLTKKMIATACGLSEEALDELALNIAFS